MSLQTHAQSQEDVALAGEFVGMWRLVSWTLRLADGTTRPDPRSVGYIVYTDTGRVCYVNIDPNRPKWTSETAPTAEEAISGIMGLRAYCGRVEVHAGEGFVVHHIDVDPVPNAVGQDRKRWFRFEGRNRLVLRVDPPELVPPIVESTLVWERVQD